MAIKPKATVNQFITSFIGIFFGILAGAFGIIIFPLMLLSFFTVSKFLVMSLFLGMTVIGTVIAVLGVRWKYNINEIPVLQATLKLVGIIGLLPLVSYVPAMFIGRTPVAKDLTLIFGVTIWLLIIGIITYFTLKLSK